MTEKDKLVSLGHDYDGIQEYDNPSPRWWNWLFFMTIIYSAWYLGYYWGMGAALAPMKGDQGMTAWSTAKYDVAVQKAKAVGAKSEPEKLEGEALLAHLNDPKTIEQGTEVYNTHCVACHSTNGQGLVGPNLTDDYYIHGGTPEDIINIIKVGVPAKGMEAWLPKIGLKKIRQVAGYILSIKGMKVDNPKAPEGEKK